MFLIIVIIIWPNFIVWLPVRLKILGNMCITFICLPGCDVINFKIGYILLIKQFSMQKIRQKNQNKKSRQKLNILRTKRAFEVKWKAFFIIFKELSVTKNCLRPESAPLSWMLCKSLFNCLLRFNSSLILAFNVDYFSYIQLKIL